MSITQPAESLDTPHANDELLTMKEVAGVVRVPVARCATGATSGPAHAASVSVEASATGAPKSFTGSNSRATILRQPAEARLRIQMEGRMKHGQHRETTPTRWAGVMACALPDAIR